MHLSPGGQAAVSFSVNLGGTLDGSGTTAAVVLRNGVVTAVPTVITEPTPGQYVVTFTVPATWVEYDLVEVHFEYTWAGGTIGCPKPAGVVTITPQTTEFIADLLVADQVKIDNMDGTYTIQYYQAGTGQTVLLHEQVQTGDPCAGDVSLIAIP